VDPNQPEPNQPNQPEPSGLNTAPSESFQPEPLAPISGYAVPYLAQPGHDPLISADYSGWWQRSIAIVKAGWPQLAAVQAIGVAVQVLLQVPLLVYVATQSQQFAVDTQNTTTPDLTPIFGALGFTFLIAFAGIVVGAIVTIATMQMSVSIATGGQPRLGPALSAAAKRAFPLIGWQLLAGLIMLVGLCACVLPFFYFLAVFTVMPGVVAFERTNAISRCFRLFHANLGVAVGRVATIVGISIGAGVFASIISGIVGGGGGGFGFSATVTTESTGAIFVASAISAIIGAVIDRGVAIVTGPLTLTAYADMRARVEPLTTQTLLQELGE
jgi:hypothetical protein